MSGGWKTWLSLAAGAALLGFAGPALACPCGPPPPPPPCGCRHHHRPPPVTIQLNVGAQASASALAGAQVSGGGGYWLVEQGTPSLVEKLDVVGAERWETRKVAYKDVRKVRRMVIVQAVCIDDKRVPHPASQVHPERDVAEDYEGEIFRCIAGTRLEATVADWKGDERFSGGETMDCLKGQALYRAHSGDVVCLAQKPERDCNERSLLRRYGAGVKVLTLVREETVTDYREERVKVVDRLKSTSITLDGGVGGVIR
jgi:hypothetical protein